MQLLRKLFLLAIAATGIVLGQQIDYNTQIKNKPVITNTKACVGSPGNTVANHLVQCMDTAGVVYACKNVAGCTVAADWVTPVAGSFTALTGDATSTGTGGATTVNKVNGTSISASTAPGQVPNTSTSSAAGWTADQQLGEQNTMAGSLTLSGSAAGGGSITVYGSGVTPGSSVISVNSAGTTINLGSTNATVTTAGALSGTSLSLTTTPLASGSGGTGVANTATLTLGSSNQDWGSLGTGLVKNTTTTGALSIAADTDINSTFGSQTATYVYAAPNATAGTPSFRALVASDVPTLNQNTSGTAAGLSSTLALASGGTNQTTWTASRCVHVNSAGTSLEATAADCGTGGSMSWPVGGAGIPNYTGSSSWGTTYGVVTSLGVPGANTNIPTEAAVRYAISTAGGGTVTSSGPPVIHQLPVFTASTDITGITVPASGTLLQGVASSDPAWTATPTLGVTGTTAGSLTMAASASAEPSLVMNGHTSGAVTVKPQAAAGTPSILWPTGSGTVAVVGSSPINVSATSGAVSCATCATSASALTAHGVVVGAGSQEEATLAVPASGTVLTGVASSDPAFSATPTLGVQNTTQGTLTLAGSASTAAELDLNIAGANAYPAKIVPGANAAPVTLTLPNTTTTLIGQSASDTTTTHVLHASAAGGIGTFAAIAAADLPADLSSSSSINGTAIGASKTILYTDTAAGSFPTLNQNTSGTAAGLSATLAAGSGGTGVANTATLTLGTTNQNWATLGSGLVVNTTTTGALSNAAYGDVTSLFGSGSCSGYLKSDGSCDTPTSTGTVTHTGDLTAGYLVQGNAIADVTITGVAVDINGKITAPGGVASGGTADGVINLGGTTSGTVTQTVADAAGTWTFTWPTAAPTSSNKWLTGTTGGVASWAAIAAGDLPATLTSGTAITNAALTTPAITSSLQAVSAGGATLGSAAKPFSYIFMSGSSATAGTNHFKLTGTATSGERTIVFPDVGTDTGATVVLSPTSTTTTQVLHATATAGLYTPAAIAAADLPANQTIRQMAFHFDGGGSALSTTMTSCAMEPVGGTITGWYIEGDQAGTATFALRSVAFGSSYTGTAGFAGYTDVTGGGTAPSVTAAAYASSTTLTSWVTTWTAGQILCAQMTSPATFTWVNLHLKVTAN